MTMTKILNRITAHCENSRDYQAIRRGFMLMIPIVIISSFALVFVAIPIPAYQAWLQSPGSSRFYDLLRLLQAASGNYLSMLLCTTIAWSYAHEWELPIYQACLLPLTAVTCFFIGIGLGTPAYHADYLGSAGMLTGILIAILVSRLYIFLFARIRVLPVWDLCHIHPQIHSIIYSVIPITAVLGITALLQAFLGYCTGGLSLQSQFALSMSALFHEIQDMPLPADLLFISLTQLLWFFGIHGQNVLFDINSHYYVDLLQQNITAAAAGAPPLHIISVAFNNGYLLMGGSGCALALLLAILLFSHSAQARTLSKLSLIPACFNISEIMLFGLPVILNPVFFLPFLAVPLLNLLLAFACTASGLVPVLAQNVSWITPPLLSGFLTGGPAGLLLQLLLLGLDILIYMPFIRLYDEQEITSFKNQVRQLETAYQELEKNNEALQLRNLPHALQITAVQLIRDLGRALSRRHFPASPNDT